MLLGTTQLYLNKTISDEWGIYRVNETKQSYLLFSFDDRDEALHIGDEISNILSIPFHPLPPTIKVEGEVRSALHSKVDTGEKLPERKEPEKKKRVMGVTALCQQLLAEGKSDEEIEAAVIQKYVDSGRTEKDGKWSAYYTLAGIRKANN